MSRLYAPQPWLSQLVCTSILVRPSEAVRSDRRRSYRNCVPAARIAAIARTIRMPPRKTNWQLWAAGSPKKLNTIQPAWQASKHCPAQRGRRRSTAQLSVAGVEALPSSVWQASKHCPGAASHVSRSSLLLRGVRAAPPRIILPPRLLPRRVPRLPLLGLEPRHLSF